jgi:hypothetical protein
MTTKTNNMKAILGTNWKTSLIGLVGALALLVVDYVKPGDIDLKTIVESAVAYLIGRFAADSGTK